MKRHIFLVKGEEHHFCPLCGGILTVRDSKLRHAISKDGGTVSWYRLRRFRCKRCRKIHTELPNFLQPFKHYESQMIQDSLDKGNKNYCGAEESTLYRWRAFFSKEKFNEVYQLHFIKTAANRKGSVQ